MERKSLCGCPDQTSRQKDISGREPVAQQVATSVGQYLIDILFDDPVLVVAGAQNRWARRRRVEPADLINEPWILPRPDTSVGALIADTFRGCGLNVPRAAVIANSIHMNNALLATGHFLTMSPSSLLKLSAIRRARSCPSNRLFSAAPSASSR